MDPSRRWNIRYWIERFHHMSMYDRKLTSAIVLILIYLFAGTIIFNALEGWGFVNAFYFSATTLLTVGFGDFTPTTPLSKILVVIYAFTGISTVLYCITIIGRRAFEDRQHTISSAIDTGFNVAKDISSADFLSMKKRTTWEKHISHANHPHDLHEQFPPPKQKGAKEQGLKREDRSSEQKKGL